MHITDNPSAPHMVSVHRVDGVMVADLSRWVSRVLLQRDGSAMLIDTDNKLKLHSGDGAYVAGTDFWINLPDAYVDYAMAHNIPIENHDNPRTPYTGWQHKRIETNNE